MLDKLVTKEGYELITIQQAAEKCGVIVRTIHNWIQDGRVEVKYKVGRVWLIDKNEVFVASESYQKTKPRSGEPKAKIKNAA